MGRADELLSLLCLARPIERCPLLLAPAMNREMWAHPATQRNLAQLRADGCTILGPAAGDQACGEIGDGRMLEATELCEELVAFFQPKRAGRQACADHRRAHLRGHRPGARHHQPVQRQDGLCHRARGAGGRRDGDAGRRPGATADAAPRDAHRCAKRAADARCGAAAGGASRCLRRHRGGGRLAAGRMRRAEDQEGRQRPRAEHPDDREPRHPGGGGEAAGATLLRGLRGREPRAGETCAREARCARACR